MAFSHLSCDYVTVSVTLYCTSLSFCSDSFSPMRHLLPGTPEMKPVVGLSWQPQLPISSSLKATDGSHVKTQTEPPSSTVWKFNSELVDSLSVPPNDPEKMNKLLRKQVKVTAGKNGSTCRLKPSPLSCRKISSY